MNSYLNKKNAVRVTILKTKLLLLLLLGSGMLFNVYPQFLSSFPDSIGIPLIANSVNDMGEYHLDSMKTIGINALIASNLNSSTYEKIRKRGFKIIPNQAVSSIVGKKDTLILKYTHSFYSRWQAEGTPPQNGKATLNYNHSIGAIFKEGKRGYIFSNEEYSHNNLSINRV